MRGSTSRSSLPAARHRWRSTCSRSTSMPTWSWKTSCRGRWTDSVPAKKILGFVQLAPRGIPLTPLAFQQLLVRQFGSIGGPLACIMDIGNSGQKLRVNFIDVNASVDTDGTTPVFVAAARGQVVLPKDGSWSLVMHARGTGDVTPLPESVSVPLDPGRRTRRRHDISRTPRCCASPIRRICCAHPPPTPSISASCRAPTRRRRCS